MEDKDYLQMAIDESRKCVPDYGSYCVGAVVVTSCGEIYTGYTHEIGEHNHAEEEAISKATIAGVSLEDAIIYSSMEPCSTRASKPRSCSQLIIEHNFRKVVYALGEPPVFVECCGVANLIEAGIEVLHLDEMSGEVRLINSHLLE